MLRIVALVIALTVTAGQDAALWCKVWCDSQSAAASGCHDHHEESNSPSVAEHHDCGQMAVSVGTFLREVAGRTVAAPVAVDAIPGLCYAFTQLTPDGRPDQEPGREWWLEARPFRLTLRI